MNYESLIPDDIDEDIRMEQTCGACPEQYDMFYKEEYIGYFRLRHGYYTVDNKYGRTVYSANPEGDGCFEWEERDFYLTMGKIAVLTDAELINIEQEIPTESQTIRKNNSNAPTIKF